jgi:hypothetical protein
MASKKPRTSHYSFEFDYTVTSVGVPQPFPVPPANPSILFRLSPAENDEGRKFSVLNICGNREGLEYLAAMILLSADSAKYDPEFHIHLEHVEGVETDIDVTIRAPAYLNRLKSRGFSEIKGTPIEIPDPEQSDK